MKKIFNLLMFLFFLVSASTCKDKVPPFDRVYRFWVKNNSQKSIAFLVSYNYPDTIIPDAYNKIRGVSPGSKTSYDSKEKWEDVFSKLPADTLSIFIFDGDTLSKYDWQVVRNNYKILKRYDISLDDLYNNNGIIAYP